MKIKQEKRNQKPIRPTRDVSNSANSTATCAPILALSITSALLAGRLLPPLFSLIRANMYGVLSFPVTPFFRASFTASVIITVSSELGISCSLGIGLQKSCPDVSPSV